MVSIFKELLFELKMMSIILKRKTNKVKAEGKGELRKMLFDKRNHKK